MYKNGTRKQSVILFDGVCNLCSGWVQFVIKRDPKKLFKFAPLQSELGNSIIKDYNIKMKGKASIILIEHNKVHIESTAILRIISQLKGPIKVLRLFSLIPKPLRDKIYRLISRNRYRLFGKKETCLIPSKEIQNRFITDQTESRKINE
ncbi:thiol-disulfide oxidoreductase DCC family protein [Bacillus sp. TL12]|uniref:thiol-disulfide oxidoreductase DCC family protein n=1 Tax=Bacillus sp. TL12 TaxID=2894756 RepID=UPI001F520605|nr:thiol-disulfide oxidoreductase DCC family protein [Bacillus sp. TL12]MCI0768499.1 thiol-disulfide oxidoreductase DCC family protein [Bacillus sp. TL12]